MARVRERHSGVLELQAESKTLPEFLSLWEIGYLLGKNPESFIKFIKTQPLEIVVRDNWQGRAQPKINSKNIAKE